MEWISVNDRLPKIGETVLTFRPLALLSNDPMYTVQKYTGKKNVSPQGVAHGFDRWCHPTHWMPLPPPPTKTQTNEND